MPNPTFRINIVSRKEGESAVSAAAYQTGEHIYSRRDREVTKPMEAMVTDLSGDSASSLR